MQQVLWDEVHVRCGLQGRGVEGGGCHCVHCPLPWHEGQDLCYVCHQRAQRNVPMSFADQIRERELNENAMWQEYDRQQRELHNAKEQAAKMRSTRYAKDAAAFNYEVSMTKEVCICKK